MRVMGCLVLALVVGCSPVRVESDGGQDAGVMKSGLDAGATDSGLDPGATGATDGGLWPGDARLLEAMRGVGGFEQGCPVDGGMVFGASYVVPFDGGPMTYSECVQGTRAVRSGSKALGADELAALEGTLRDLSVGQACGYDKGELSLTITTSTKVLRYVDSFYACQHRTGVVYVDHIDEVFAKLDELAR